MDAISTIVTINSKGLIQSVDKNFTLLFGYSFEELEGQPVTMIIPSPYREQHSTYMANYMSSGIQKIIGKSRVVEGQHKNGTIFPINLSVTQIGKREENPLFIGVIHKILDQACLITISVEGTIVSCNQNIQEFFGYAVNEVIGKNVSILMPMPYSSAHNGFLQRYLETGDKRVIGKIRSVPGRHKTGAIFPFSLQVEEEVIGQMRLFKGRLDRVDTSLEAFFTLSEEGKIDSCNTNFVKTMFGYDPSELIDQHISALIPDLSISSDNENYYYNTTPLTNSPTSESPKIRSMEHNLVAFESLTHHKVPTKHAIKHKDGSMLPIYLSLTPFYQNSVKKFIGKIQRVPYVPHPESFSGELIQIPSSTKIGLMYALQQTLGHGTYGTVKAGQNLQTNEKVAIKILNKREMEANELIRVRREIEILKTLHHINICQLYEVIETETKLYLIMEFGGDTLFNYVMKSGGLSEDEARNLFKQILAGLSYCHHKNIIHRDIKHKNILLTSLGTIKLIDFGLSNYMEEGRLRSTFCGTPAYAAPEMIVGEKYQGPEVDVWSLGVVLYSMIAGKFPFENVAQIIKGHYDPLVSTSKECQDFISLMLNVDPKGRANVDTLNNHTWLIPTPVLVFDRSNSSPSNTIAPNSPNNSTSNNSTSNNSTSNNSTSNNSIPINSTSNNSIPINSTSETINSIHFQYIDLKSPQEKKRKLEDFE